MEKRSDTNKIETLSLKLQHKQSLNLLSSLLVPHRSVEILIGKIMLLN